MKTLISATVAALLLTACTPLSPVKTPLMTTYLLKDPLTQEKNPSALSKKDLLVSTPMAPRWLNSNEMAYETADSRINYFSQNQWAAPPAQMLEPIMAHALQESGFYHAVLQSPFIGNVDQRLDVQLINFQQDFSTSPSIYNMAIQAQLVDVKTGNVLRSQRFNYSVPTTSNDPEGGVHAANKAIEEWIPQLIAFCRKSPASI